MQSEPEQSGVMRQAGHKSVNIKTNKGDAMAQTDDKKNSAYAPQMRYAKKYIKRISFDFNVRTDADIIAKLDSVPQKATYIKKLIRDDIKKSLPTVSGRGGKKEHEDEKSDIQTHK